MCEEVIVTIRRIASMLAKYGSPNEAVMAVNLDWYANKLVDQKCALDAASAKLTEDSAKLTEDSAKLTEDNAKLTEDNVQRVLSPDVKETKLVDELRRLTDESRVVHAINEMWNMLRVDLVKVAKSGKDRHIIYYYNFDHLYKYIDDVEDRLREEGLTVQVDRGLLSHKVTITW